MKQYHQLVEKILTNGNYKPNRTGVDTISSFSQSYKIDLQEGFPLLTTKKMDGYRWNSLIHELIWYFSGEEHIRNLREETKIWDAWANEEGQLETAYGRFWRRFPIPEEGVEGESWAEKNNNWVNEEEQGLTFDQIQYVIDQLNENPNSRRIVVNAWHPGNATVSKLPPCHFTFVFNVQGNKLNTHLTQRSGDTALGIPFNIAAYSLITHIIANQTDLEVGEFSHTVVDAHIYCGKNQRGEWYGENLSKISKKMRNVESREDYLDIKKWIEENAPPEKEGNERFDHVPGLLEQLSREPLERPEIMVKERSIDEIEYEDIKLRDYDSYEGIKFEVAE